jgi:hypothetical protein
MKKRTLIAAIPFALLTQAGAMAAEPQVPFAAGGVSMEQRSAMQTIQGRFNTQMTFAIAQTGHYVADVDVSITDRRGNEMLTTQVPGPVLYAQLPPGSYKIAATYGGKQQVRNFTVSGDRTAKVNMYWNEPSNLTDKEQRIGAATPPTASDTLPPS